MMTMFLCTPANKNVNSSYKRYSPTHELMSNRAQKRQRPDYQNKPRCPSHIYMLRSRQILLCPMPVPAPGWEMFSSPLFKRPGERQCRGVIPLVPAQALGGGLLWPRWLCWPLGCWSEVCHALPLTTLFMLALEILSPGRQFKWGYVSTKGSCSDKRVSSENPQPALCWTPIQALRGLVPTSLICSCFSKV